MRAALLCGELSSMTQIIKEVSGLLCYGERERERESILAVRRRKTQLLGLLLLSLPDVEG